MANGEDGTRRLLPPALHDEEDESNAGAVTTPLASCDVPSLSESGASAPKTVQPGLGAAAVERGEESGEPEGAAACEQTFELVPGAERGKRVNSSWTLPVKEFAAAPPTTADVELTPGKGRPRRPAEEGRTGLLPVPTVVASVAVPASASFSSETNGGAMGARAGVGVGWQIASL